MPNEQQRRLMQEALDDILPEAARQDLFAHLDDDEASFAEFNQLRRVHNLLKTAPFERAPRRIAATIMARLAEGMEQDLESSTHQQTQSRAQVEMSQELLELAVSLVTVATLPLLVAASWMVVNAYADPSLLTMVVQQMIALLRLVLEILSVFLEQAQRLASEDPQAALALLALIPVTMLALVRYLLSDTSPTT